MASFQAKIGWKTQRKRENKNCQSVSFRSYPTRNRKFQKNSKKIKKVKKYNYGIISSQKQVRKGGERDKIKIIGPFRSVPTRREIGNYKKKSNKIEKIKIYHYGFISSQNRMEKAERMRENKNYRSVPFCSYPMRNREFKKKQQKN